MSTNSAAAWASPKQVARMYLALLPVGVVVNIYLLIVSRATVESERELSAVSFGWPFAWVTQDLSRYQPREFPTTVEFEWQRAWYDPIVTSYDGVLFIANSLILGAALTLLFFVAVPAIRAIVSSTRGARSEPVDPK